MTKTKFFKAKEKHCFHLVESSHLPIVSAFSVMLLVLGIVFYWNPHPNLFVARVDALALHIASINFTVVLFN